MDWQQLIAIARLLARAPEFGEARGRPQQARLRRAISTVYYAVFHALANNNADALIGTSPDLRQSEEWARTYRALDHGFAKDRFNSTSSMLAFPENLQDFGHTFIALQNQRHDADYNPRSVFHRSDIALQNQRHDADYNPRSVFQRSETIRAIERAEAAIADLTGTDFRIRRALATYVLFRTR